MHRRPLPHPTDLDLREAVEPWSELDVRVRWAAAARPTDELPVVVVHGLGVSGDYMAPLARAFARTRDVLLPDLPGHGRSDDPPRVAPDEAAHAALLAELVERRWPGRRVVVVGNSWGAQIALQLAADRPDLVAGAVLLGPAVDRTSPRLVGQVARLCSLLALERPGAIRAVLDGYLHAGPGRSVREFRTSLRWPLDDVVGRVEVPVLLLRGARDPLCSPAWLDHLAARLRDPHRGTLGAGTAHVLSWGGAVEPVVAAVDAFTGARGLRGYDPAR